MRLFLCFVALCLTTMAGAQDDDMDLLSLLGDDDATDYTIASFKANRVINLHSLELTTRRVFDFKISHRLGVVSGGFKEWYGLDQASIRIGGDYGVTDRLMIGLGRSSFEKTYDGYAKYKFLRQSTGKVNMPITALLLTSFALKTVDFTEQDRKNFFSSRMTYAHQLIIGRKFSESFSLLLSPTLVHRNIVKTLKEKNDVFALGIGSRIKLNNRFSLNTEYIFVGPNQLDERYRNSISVGVDIETGGHVFQLHFTNSTAMTDKGVVTETTDNWLDGGMHFGFNISRVFNIPTKEDRLKKRSLNSQ